MIALKFIFVLLSAVFIQFVWLQILERLAIYQHVYELAPIEHQKKKRVPSLGGVGIYISIAFGFLVLKPLSDATIWLFVLFTLFTLIGFADDMLSLLKGKNEGLKAKDKFFLQAMTAIIMILVYALFISPISIIMMFFFIFILVGSANATNLTDGLDGLLSGLAIISFFGFFLIFYQTQSNFICQSILIFIMSIAAFLVFNKTPAKIYMGDTGSLGLGAAIAGLSVILNNPWILVSLGGVYIIETLSVIIQVISFKLRKKRIFLMSPLHHHFELLGIPQYRVVLIFYAMGIIFFLISLIH